MFEPTTKINQFVRDTRILFDISVCVCAEVVFHNNYGISAGSGRLQNTIFADDRSRRLLRKSSEKSNKGKSKKG